MSILSNSFLLWNTVRYLKFSQIKERIWKKVKRVKINLSPAGEVREQIGDWVEPARQSQRMIGKRSFCFLNEAHEINSAVDWNNDQWSKLWIYNLHYFDDLTAIDAGQRVDWHRTLIQRWIDENPVGVGNGWEPYPLSLRIVNWVKWSLAGNEMKENWLHSLVFQIRYLSQNLETHLLGNHLFANAKALLFAGLFFEGKEAEEWYKVGLVLAERELSEQVLADGGNFELSTMYHLIFLEDLLDLINVHRVYDRTLPQGLDAYVVSMNHWLDAMIHPDGEISFFNDAAFGVTPPVAELKKYFDRITEFSGLTGFYLSNKSLVNSVKDSLIDLIESGYSRVEIGNAVALIDRAAVGPDYLPAHAHADTLSFELSLFGQRVIVNSGTSVYGVGKQRQLERGTAAHSTLVIDSENSSEVWGGFRVARRAKVFDREQSESDGKVRLSACHDGYKRLSGKPVHCRKWLFEDGMLTINDRISGKGVHIVESVLPLYPKITVVCVESNKIALEVLGQEVVMLFEGKGQLELFKSSYHPEFGLSVENKKIIFRCKERLPVEMTMRICW